MLKVALTSQINCWTKKKERKKDLLTVNQTFIVKIFSISQTRQNRSLPLSIRSAKGRGGLLVRFVVSSSDGSLSCKDAESDSLSESFIFGKNVDGSNSGQLYQKLYGNYFYLQSKKQTSMWSIFNILSHSKKKIQSSAKHLNGSAEEFLDIDSRLRFVPTCLCILIRNNVGWR